MKYLILISILFAALLFNTYSMGYAQKFASSNSFVLAGTSSQEYEEITTSGPTDEQVEQESPDDEEFLMLDEELEEEIIEVADPVYYWNKAMYHFNDKFYFWVLKPAARGYKRAVPEVVRTGVRNFFHNLRFPIRFVGCLLQTKGSAAAGEFGRFVLNSTVGLLGFGNPAKKYPALNPSEEDVGQAFGRWGIGNGFYIVWPFLGPSTLRDSVGLVGDLFLDPVFYVEPTAASIGINVYDNLNDASFRIGEYESLKEAAIDPYVAIRSGYIQYRNTKISE